MTKFNCNISKLCMLLSMLRKINIKIEKFEKYNLFIAKNVEIDFCQSFYYSIFKKRILPFY